MAESVNERLRRGELVPVGNKLYGWCRDCRSVVQVNKWLLGSLHVCVEPEPNERTW